MTIREAASALRERRLSSVELARHALKRIERLNPKLNAFITLTAESALERARLADAELAAGRDRGPLHGIPIAHKDLFYTRGVRTTGGSKVYERFVPDSDAYVVEKLDSAGAVSLGKLNMHELAFGITSGNPHFGPVRNPWNPEHIPGGSSGGSAAAVASEMVFAATASDTGGSIRIPASLCGTVGLKPTYGRVSRFGTLPLAFSLDHMGPLARTVRDAALVLNAIAGYDPRDPASAERPVEDFMPEPSKLEKLLAALRKYLVHQAINSCLQGFSRPSGGIPNRAYPGCTPRTRPWSSATRSRRSVSNCCSSLESDFSKACWCSRATRPIASSVDRPWAVRCKA